MAVQRIRVKYGRTGELQYISHLDMMRAWHRAFRRAGISLAYSDGYTPRPRFSMAAALPVGVTAEGELMDLFLKRRLSPFYFLKLLSQQLPQGLQVIEAYDVPLGLPSLQSQVRKAEYRVVVATEATSEAIRATIGSLLEKKTLPWEHLRDKEVRRYDLRAQVYDIRLDGLDGGEATLVMLLKTEPSGSGRPEQVVAALGLPVPPRSIHRTRLLLAEPELGER